MHALAALRAGDRPASLGGQVSLSPIPHIRREPIGMLGVPLLTAFTNGWAVGWASTPYDPVWAARYPRRAALMAAAGPTGNLLIAGLALLCLMSARPARVSAPPSWGPPPRWCGPGGAALASPALGHAPPFFLVPHFSLFL